MDKGLEERIRERAHAIWERDGRSGAPDDRWLEAEREIVGATRTDNSATAYPATRANAIGGPDPTAGAHAASPETPPTSGPVSSG